MDKWHEYRTYENWKQQNIDALKVGFDACEDERLDMIEPPNFDDFCMGTWQRL